MGNAKLKTQVITAMFLPHRWEHIKKDKQRQIWWGLVIVQSGTTGGSSQEPWVQFLVTTSSHLPLFSPHNVKRVLFLSETKMCKCSIASHRTLAWGVHRWCRWHFSSLGAHTDRCGSWRQGAPPRSPLLQDWLPAPLPVCSVNRITWGMTEFARIVHYNMFRYRSDLVPRSDLVIRSGLIPISGLIPRSDLVCMLLPGWTWFTLGLVFSVSIGPENEASFGCALV